MKRRLLTLGHSYAVGANRRLAHELARAGAGEWEVVCAAPRYFRGSRDLSPVTLHPADESCRLVPLSAHLTGRVHVFFYGLGLRSLLAEGWDVVHCWEEPFVVAGRQVAWWTPRRAALVYVTCQNLPKRYPPPFSSFERQSMRRAAGWVGIGRTVLDTLGDRPGYRDRPGQVIPLGVDVEHFRPDPAAGAAVRCSLGWAADGPPVVGFLGRFVPEKGLSLLTRALEAVRTPWRALFVGCGECEPTLRQWAARCGDRVRIQTGVKHDQVPAWLNAMDLLCAPSQTTPRWREQFGRMTVEAFACGVPVIGSDSGEIPFVIGRTGEIVAESDAGAWAEAIGRLIDSPHRRRDLAAEALARVPAEFAWPAVARRYLDFFDAVSAGRG
jgi:glycosyltransferase involved in cell wall biosynthesis